MITCPRPLSLLNSIRILLQAVPLFCSLATMSNHPLIGKPAPVLSLPNADGTSYEIKPGAEGKPTAVFFYPKAGAFPLSTTWSLVSPVRNIRPCTGTYGCTREVCGFRDALTGLS